MKIYTKTGDNGTTSLVGGKRVAKSDLRIECYGTIDELNAHIGMLIALLNEEFGENPPEHEVLNTLQRLLFTVGGNLACENDSPYKEHLQIDSKAVAEIEQRIDELNASLASVKSFTLPQGVKAACQSHICRTVCRRAERLIVSLESQEKVDDNITQFINRMSDYFYVLSRSIQNILCEREILWKND